MNKALIELSEKFRKGLVSRRDFVKKVAAITGGFAAAGSVLSQMGFDPGLIQEVKAQQEDILIEEGAYPSGDKQISYYLAKPKGGGPFASMIVIHEIFGISDFIKDVVRLFARSNYLAMAPCLPEGCSPPENKHAEWMRKTLETGVAGVPPDTIQQLNDGYAFLEKRLDVDPGHIGSVGFCWGGARSFALATRNERLSVSIVFYGSTPPFEDLAAINGPVLALYGALDNNSPTSITGRAAETAREMNRLGKVFEWEVYNRAPHAFFRDGSMVSTSRAATIAWDLVLDFLNRYYKRS